MDCYIVVTFAPVQGFIEKSRKLRDLYGASQILSYLSAKLVEQAKNTPNLEVISPGVPKIKEGVPNRILIKANLNSQDELQQIQQQLEQEFFRLWKNILTQCQKWIENRLESYYQNWYWDSEWKKWGNYTWELFWGNGDSVESALNNLEEQKLERAWTAINWIGESSSLTGTDAIAWPGLGRQQRNPKYCNWQEEKGEIETFYKNLVLKLFDNPTPDAGGYIADNEKLSIPELTKRLVTHPDVIKWINQQEEATTTIRSEDRFKLKPPEKFSEIVRKLEDMKHQPQGQWTAWFMGDGDNVGDYLKALSKSSDSDRDEKIKAFTEQMQQWGEKFYVEFPEDLGRVVYAGGDDFLGIIYNPLFDYPKQKAISGQKIIDWLISLPEEWKAGKSEKINQNITLSLGLVWAAPSVPQRDVLQHCREAEKRSKQQGKNRVTIRVVFNSGQYVQWTCPWKYLEILDRYQDRDGGKNWSHVYNDLAQLKNRQSFGLNCDKLDHYCGRNLSNDRKGLLDWFELYFPQSKTLITDDEKEIFKNKESKERAWATIQWIKELILVGWYLDSEV
jgi:CRISPR-associated protein Cmr2